MRQSGGHFLSGRFISVWPKQKISPALRIARDGGEQESVPSFTARGAAPQVQREDRMKDGLNHVVGVAPLSPPKRRKMRRWGGPHRSRRTSRRTEEREEGGGLPLTTAGAS